MSSEIVRVATSDGLYLHGYFQPGDKNKVAILHIPGFEDNFYESDFLTPIGEMLAKEDIAWLPVNTRGNGRETDLLTTDHKTHTIGSRYELLEDALLDIDAWIEFLLEQGFFRIVLMGHSLSTMKIVRYMSLGKHADKIEKIILLSPFDKKVLLETYAKKPITELIKRAQAIIASGRGDEIISSEFDEISLSYKTFVSWYQQDDLGRCFEVSSKDYSLPALQKIQVPTKIIVGSKDDFFHPANPNIPQEAMDKILSAIPTSEGVIIPDAVHSFYPHEDVLAQEVVDFVI